MKADIQIKMFKNLFIVCVPTKSMTTSVTGTYASEARLGAEVEGRNYQLDYVTEDTAELGFDVNIKLRTKMTKSDKYRLYHKSISKNFAISVGRRVSCSPGDDLCDMMERTVGIEDMEDKEVTSPAIVSRLEGVLGVNTGERIKVLIPRSQLQTGIGEREKGVTCSRTRICDMFVSLTSDLVSDLYHVTDPRSLNAK